jgi:hypothetical protein
VSIDLGDAPVGTPPTAEQSNQIRTALDIFQEPSIIGEELDLITTDEPYTIFGDMLFFDSSSIETLYLNSGGSPSSTLFFTGTNIYGLYAYYSYRPINISQCTSLEWFSTEGTIEVYASGLESIVSAAIGYYSNGVYDFSNCINLTHFDAQEVFFSSVILNGCSSLYYLNIPASNMSSLDISGCTSLIYIVASMNSISESLINYITITLDSFGQEDGHLDLSENTYQPTGDGATAVTNLIAKGWTVVLNA